MFHGLTAETIYAAARLISVFDGPHGATKEVSGTGFGVMVGDKLALVTNRHMVDLTFGPKGAKYVGFTLRHVICGVRAKRHEDGAPGDAKALIVPMTHNLVRFDENSQNDVAVIWDVQSGNLDGTTDRRWEYCFEYSDIATDAEIRSDLHPFDLLAFPGFPNGVDPRDVRAIIRGGTVACDPRFDYSFEAEDRGEIVLFEGFSFGGSSGSPVIAVPKVPPANVDPHPANRFRRMLVVGVNAGHLTVPTGQHAGLSYFVRSSAVRRIIDSAAGP